MEFDFEGLAREVRYKLLCAYVAPRPIALVTTLSPEGVGNAAPMSFFNVISDEPPIVIISIRARPDGSPKDTTRNIKETGEFVVPSRRPLHGRRHDHMWNRLSPGRR